MKTLQSLHKIVSKKVEESQEEIAKLIGVMQEMDDRENHLMKQIDSEYQTVSNENDALLYTFAGKFSEKAKDEIKDIKQARIDAEKILSDKREKLRIRFAEQKRYDILLERKKLELKKAKDKKEQAELDELSSVRFIS
jgi:flagellar export protein FliJ